MELKFISKLAASMAFIILCTGCWILISHDEVARASSPDGRTVAVLYETNGGATTSFGYEVELRSKGSRQGKSVAHLYGAVRNEQAYGVNLHWENNDTLALECLRTETTPDFKSSVDVGGQNIQIVLHTGVEDKAAPSGGMQYNLHRH